MAANGRNNRARLVGRADAQEATADPVASSNELSLVWGRTSFRSKPTLP
jgi:hypothetical protein